MKDGIVIEDIIDLFEAVNSLGKELGSNISWGQYSEMNEMMGRDCIHTKQAARNVIMNEQVYKRLQELHEKMEQVIDE